MTDLYPVPDYPPTPDALPSLQHLMDLYRPNPHPSPLLETYSYLGVSYCLDEQDVHAAERAFEDHIAACEEFEMDGCSSPGAYCGCSDCFYRASAGFWISYIISALRSGRASAKLPPEHTDQLSFPLDPDPTPEIL